MCCEFRNCAARPALLAKSAGWFYMDFALLGPDAAKSINMSSATHAIRRYTGF